jgi:hypothetical protein
VTRFYDSESEVDRVGLGFLARSLPKPEWTHAAHFAATLWLMRRRPDIPLSEQMPALIRAYNVATGGENTATAGYHETITQASIRATKAFADGFPPTRPLHEAVNALMASPLGDKDWLLTYWTRERLFSIAARRAWLEPDLRALPF